MTKTLIAQGSITIMDLSDPYVSSTPPENPFENMLWLDTSVNPPILRIYVYYYDEDGNVIDKAWVVVGEENPIPTGIAFGGYLTCQVTITDSTKGQIGVSMGYFSSNKIKKTIISTGFTMQTQLTSNQARKRYIIFTNKDTSFTYNSLTGINDSFVIAIRQNGKWYYENGNTLVEFEPKDEYCNVGKIVEYSSSDNKNGIKEIIMYAENPESIFNLLTGEGERQGLFTTEDGKVFVNGEYINAKNLRVVDTNNKVTFYINEQGEVTINATEFTLKGKDVQDYIDEGMNLDQTTIFNKLTNNGKSQGLYMQDGNFYFNGQYINAKNLKVVDSDNNTTFYVDQDGNVTIRAKDFSLEGKTIDSYISDVNTDINTERERINEILNDSTLIPSEKRQLQRMLEDIYEEYVNIANIAQGYNINFSNFYAAYNTLSNYLTIDCKINDLTISTGIIKDTLKTCFENYYTERTKLNNSINSTINNNINGKLSASDSKAVFDALTESGKKQGLYLKDGNFYFNGQYINAKNLSVQNTDGETTLSIDSDGNVSILATAFKLGGKTITDIITENTVVTMKSVRIWYYISNSPTALSGGSWSTTKPTWVSGQYIWQKTVTTYSNNTTAESDPVCITGPQGEQGGKGDQGVSITKVSNRYGKSTSKTTKPTTWNTSYPSWTKGIYIWTKSIISYSNGTTTETDPYVDTSWEGMSNLVDGKVDNSQTAVFNALTNNGQEQGIYLKDGKVYVNGTYIKANTVTGAMLQGDSIDGKTITGATLEGCRIFAAKDDNQTDGHKFRIYADGRIFSNNFIQCYGETPNDNKYSELNDGYVVATEYVKSPAIKTTKQNLYFGINDVAIPGSGDNTDRLRFCEISGNKFFMPDYNATSSTNGVRLGASGHMWSTVYAKGGVNSSSDRTVKKNIRYLNAENENAIQSDDLTEKDLYNFVKNDLMVAEYNFTGDNKIEIGFIAQDLLYNLDGSDNKIGQLLINQPDEEQSPLTYSEKTYSNILAGALRQAINKIESLEKRVEELEKK